MIKELQSPKNSKALADSGGGIGIQTADSMFGFNTQVMVDESDLVPFKHKNVLLGRMRK